MPPNQRRIIKQAKLTYSLLGKAFERQTNTTTPLKNMRERIEVLKSLYWDDWYMQIY